MEVSLTPVANRHPFDPSKPTARAEAASDDHLRLLIESATDHAIFSMDLERRVTTWNTGAERLFGYNEEEIVGNLADCVFTPEDCATGEPQREADVARTNGRAEDQRWHMRKNGERFFASGALTLLVRNDEVVGFVKIARDLTKMKLVQDELRKARDELERRVQERTAELHATNAALREEIEQRRELETSRQELLRAIATAQEDERHRLSRELHDEVGQHLAALMLGLGALERDLRGTPSASELPKLQQLTETIGREIHALAVQLRPAALDDLGLQRALSTYIDGWSARSGVKVEFHSTNVDDPRLPSEIQLALYRIVQEALTNVVKHAVATRVSVILNRRDGEVAAVIEDDGRGFDPETLKPAPNSGLGLIGMKERAAQLDGGITVESEPGHGTTVFVRLPLK
jgi:PAS domain S-box-containing protein